jgi:hypothetical protein
MTILTKGLARAVLAVAAIAIATAAQAATYLITYTGKALNFATDVTGVFGPSGASLDGKDVTVVFTLTDPTPGAFVSNDGTTGVTYGGTIFGTPDPVTATVTINGITRSIGSITNAFGQAQQVNNGPFDQVLHKVEDRRLASAAVLGLLNTLEASISSSANNIVNSSNYTDPLSYVPQAGDNVFGYFSFVTVDASGATLEQAYGNFAPNLVTISAASASAVPESATWIFMIAGFGLAGVALRRARPVIALSH